VVEEEELEIRWVELPNQRRRRRWRRRHDDEQMMRITGEEE
jgi:hypothetical protein